MVQITYRPFWFFYGPFVVFVQYRKGTSMRLRRSSVVATVLTATVLATTYSAGAIEGHRSTAQTGSLAGSSADRGSDGGPLRILLTNDDGWNAPGINAVYRALTDAGHDVTMVAPAENQSGKSAAIEFQGKLTVTHPTADPKIYAVTTTPAGSAMFGLGEVFRDEKPDLVVSGTNVGSNVGFDTNYSGTVGAAIVASGAYGVPAIAISTATSRAPGATPAYEQTAELLVEILEQGVPTLADGTILNINYPVLADGASAPRGYRYTPMAATSAADIGYSRIDENSYEIRPARSTASAAAGTDAAELDAGFVTFTVMDSDRSAGRADAAPIDALLRSLR